MGQPRTLLLFIFSLSSKHYYNFYNKYTVYSAGIWTHNLRNMSLLPLPLDQGSHPTIQLLE